MNFNSLFTEEEIAYMRTALKDKGEGTDMTPHPSYIYRKKVEQERNERIPVVRMELDNLRKELPVYTPKQLKGLGRVSKQEGIYIIYNRTNYMYYIGQSVDLNKRVCQHFEAGKGNSDVYNDFKYGDEFVISLIPLENTSFTSLNELEDYAIRAYDSHMNGYNNMPGNVLDRPFFVVKEHEKVAELIISKIKDKDIFLTISNDTKRMLFIGEMLQSLGVKARSHFSVSFTKLMKYYQKEMRKRKRDT